MYIYKCIKASKSVVVILVVALALVAWGIVGVVGSTLAKGKPDDGDSGNVGVCVTLPNPGTGAGV